MGFVVLCGARALRRHLGSFPTPTGAQGWADHAHCCTEPHRVVPVAGLLRGRSR